MKPIKILTSYIYQISKPNQFRKANSFGFLSFFRRRERERDIVKHKSELVVRSFAWGYQLERISKCGSQKPSIKSASKHIKPNIQKVKERKTKKVQQKINHGFSTKRHSAISS